jgi:hypothetical protein
VSQETVEVVRRVLAPYDGRDMLPAIRSGLERLGPDPQPEAVLAVWAEDPGSRYMHPNIEWDPPEALGMSTAYGPLGVVGWWAEWVEVWQSYVYRILEYRDLGDWVMTPQHIRAVGRDGMPLEMKNAQLWQVRDGQVARVRVFFSEEETLDAVEQGP